MAVRAKFYCNSVTMNTSGPVKSMRYINNESHETEVWSRTYRFSATYDSSVPEDQWYSAATPYGNVEIKVDNPKASFEVGAYYYLDFTYIAHIDAV